MAQGSGLSGIDRVASWCEPPFPLRLLGVGLTYAWSSCLWEVPLAVGEAGAGQLQGTLVWLASAVVTPLAALLLALWFRNRELSASPGMYVAGPLMATLGTCAALWYPSADGVWAVLALVVGALGTGAGPAVLVVLWACVLARIEPDMVETVVPASFVATLVCVLVVPNLAGAAAVATVAVLPLASGVLLLLSKRSVDEGRVARFDVAEKPRGARARMSSFVRACTLIMVAYAVGCMIPALYPVMLGSSLEAAATALGMVAAVAFSALLVLFSTRVDIGTVYRWVSVPLVLAIILAAFDDRASNALSYLLGNIVFTGLEIITVLYFIRLSQRTNRTTTFLVGIGVSGSYLGVLVGYLAAPPMRALIEQGAVDPKTCALVLIGAFMFSTLLAPRRDDAWVEGLAPEDALVALPGDTVLPEASASSADPVADRCSRLAREHGLSRREAEIFELLARGRSRPYIRDTLVLSKNTVATHVKHIYQKLDVHSQQELLDLVHEGS